MNRAKFWSALLLAAMGAGSGCGTPTTTDAIDLDHAGSKPAQVVRSEAMAAPPSLAEPGLTLAQGNSIIDLSADSSAGVSIKQSNQLAVLLLDDPLELLDHYVEVPDQLVWDRTTRSFYITQQNLADYATGGVFQQINDLIVIVDRNANYYSGTIVQFNEIGHFTVEEGGQAAIAQINHMTVIHQDEAGLSADAFVAAMPPSPQGPPAAVSSAEVLNQRHELIIYIDCIGKPHLYKWQPPVGKNGLGFHRVR